ncbi:MULTISPECIES: hypothetical protein [unclassified Moorena]|uniref:hypothetical protein n=1 Tax=unclassified Moorena TaxID=2683338 RepID=UPI0013BD23E9|nr:MULTISPECIES: hypothetical protein [unclassified Moorena]NEQ15287.1 hypothetical protein [Moorena sp. SIO3E2]NER88220.1 hypothetical protein [Moorena sp. SIO3A2]NES87361.1 hypothetical protein [Moorena sp. SIO2B7]NET65373.1 hypothetical protein [Moorena sp. SIO1G6]
MGETPKTALPPQDRAASLLPTPDSRLPTPDSRLPVPCSQIRCSLCYTEVYNNTLPT